MSQSPSRFDVSSLNGAQQLLLTSPFFLARLCSVSRVPRFYPGGVCHEIRPIRMRHLWSDFRARKEPFSEVYVVKFSLYSKLVLRIRISNGHCFKNNINLSMEIKLL